MIIRSIQLSDLHQIRQVHEKFYKDEFDLPNFPDEFLTSFIITNDDNKLITVGGVRVIAESVMVTDKDIDIEIRREVLYKALQVQQFICHKNGFDQLHAFVQDEKWMHHLLNAGFNKCRGAALFINV